MSIASAIISAQNKVAAAYTSCNNMGATMPAVSDQDLSHLPATIESIPQGSSNPEAGENDVIFIDYDGTIRYSYTKAEFAQLTELPANPSHTGLTAQGWNWTLADAQSYVATYGGLVIGQMYVTDDGKTRLYISITYSGRLAVPLNLYQTNANGVEIDWGDSSATETIAGTGYVTTTHSYSAIGEYVITLKAVSGTFGLGGGSNNAAVIGAYNTSSGRAYINMLQKVETGTGMTWLTGQCLRGAASLKSVSIHKDISSISNFALGGCCFVGFVFPTGTTSISNMFDSNAALRYISYHKNFTNIGNSWATYVGPLAKVTLPPNITSVGSSALYQCLSLVKIAIPSSVTVINGNAFYNCYSLKELWVYPATPPTLNASALSGCPADMVIYVPNGKLATYQGASNWSAYSSQMVEMPA